MIIPFLVYPDDTFWAGWLSEFPSGSQELFTSGEVPTAAHLRVPPPWSCLPFIFCGEQVMNGGGAFYPFCR